jgi:hypothetical protein
MTLMHIHSISTDRVGVAFGGEGRRLVCSIDDLTSVHIDKTLKQISLLSIFFNHVISPLRQHPALRFDSSQLNVPITSNYHICVKAPETSHLRETEKYGYVSRGTQNQGWLWWRNPAANYQTKDANPEDGKYNVHRNAGRPSGLCALYYRKPKSRFTKICPAVSWWKHLDLQSDRHGRAYSHCTRNVLCRERAKPTTDKITES